MKRLKNIIIIFICFLMFSGFDNETTSLNSIPEYNVDNISPVLVGDYPASYDGRNNFESLKNIPSENQGPLNICWAFSMNNVIEAYMNKKISSSTVYNYSENQYDYVARYLGDTKSFGESNTTFNVVKYLFYNISPFKELEFDSSGYFTTYKDKEINSYLNLSKNSIDLRELKLFSPLNYNYLMNSGKSSTEIEEGMKSFNSQIKDYIKEYGAVMSIIHTKFLTQTSNGSMGWCYNDGKQEDSSYSSSAHAVTIIGWDDNYVWTGSNKAPYKGAWIAANSWGSNTPYFYISYYDYSVSRAFIGVSQILDNTNGSIYTNSYLAGESTSFFNTYGDNRLRSYKRVSTSNTSESFEIYIGDGAETIKSAKLLYLGFKNATEVPRNLKVQITVSTPNIIPTFKDKDVNFGINYYNLTAKSISGNVTVNVSISNNGSLKISDMLYAVELFTNNSNSSSIIYTNGNSSISNTVNSRFSYNMVSKNLNATEKDKYSVKLYDSQNNDITSKFNIKKDDFAFDTSKITLIQKEALSTNNITLKTTVGSTVSTKNINISSTGYTFNGLLVDETNMIIYGVSPNMTVSEFLSKINGGTKTVYNASGTAVSTTSNMGTGYTVKINYNNNDYIYNISILGDVNSDGKVNISDVMKIATQITKGKQITKQMELDASDVTKDDKINISDVMKVATYIVKKVGL